MGHGNKGAKMTHLRYEYQTAFMKCGISEHAQKGMERLGITYTHSTPQSMGDQFWFWNCSNVPDPLPEYISTLDVDPMECIGFGLSLEMAEEIRSQNEIQVQRDD